MGLNILLDTNVYVAIKKGNSSAISLIYQANIIAVNTVVMAELLAGFTLGNKEKQNIEEFNQFLELPQCKFLSINQETAKYYAQIFKQLKLSGNPIPTNDIWIAASALQHDLALFTYDKHFKNIRNLKLMEF